MMLAILVGVVIITYFIADIVNRSKIEELTSEHIIELEDVHSKTENFTDNFLRGSVKMDLAREVREVGNYHFDFALFWFNMALVNTTNSSILSCTDNCNQAMRNYLTSYERFGESSPFFSEAKMFTTKARYHSALNQYINFTLSGQTITMLRYNASYYLRQMAENLSLGNMENLSQLWTLFNETIASYQDALEEFNENKDDIDGNLFFTDDRQNEEEP
jgi:hypothetical protein